MSGEDISFPGRIAAICDVYDALLTERPYKTAWTVQAALAYIESERGRHFDPGLADTFITLIGEESSPPSRIEFARAA